MYRMGEEEISAVTRVIKSGKLFKVNDGGQEVNHFEEEWRKKMGSKYAICMTSGKGALISGLVGMGIGPGDEVIIPAYTYIASAIAILAAGAIPVIVDVDETLTIDVEDVKRKITPNTKAIMPVHIMGFPCDMDAVMEVANEYGLQVIEDACQADGGSYHGKRLGTIGHVGAYSFNYFKVISAGEGGLMATDDKDVFEKALIFHDSSAVAYFGNQLENVNVPLFAGNEYRVSEIVGAIMREQLKKLDGILEDLRKNRDWLIENLEGTGLEVVPSHDRAGELGTVLPLRFSSEEKARKFATCDGINGTLPIDTDKHVYSNWDAIMEKRGSADKRSDPYLREENQKLHVDYAKDMCPKTLDYLATTVYVDINPDWTQEERKEKLDLLKKAAQQI